MGASGWSYYVAYDADFAAALVRLQQQVLARGDHYTRNQREPKTLAQLRELAGENGMRSILDITRIGPRPSQPGREDPFRPPGADARGMIDMARFDEYRASSCSSASPATDTRPSAKE